jgi:hypothetical protein
MIKNLIEAYLTTENENSAVQNLNAATALLPFLQGLTADERQALPKMGKGAVDFVERTLMYAQDQTSANPQYLELQSLIRDYTLYRQVGRIIGILEPMMGKLRDSKMLLGAQSYQTSRLYYRYLKTSSESGVPGTDAIYRDLAQWFKKTRTKKSDSSTDTTKASAETQEQKES